jgi:prepilin-type N-terminal cleavage/methylation domain-containing protein
MQLDSRPAQRARPRPLHRCAAFSLVELMIAVVVLTVAVSGFSSSVLSSMVLNRMNRETDVAQQAARRALEELQSEEFGQVFAAFNATVGDYAGSGAEAAPGFAVAGLDLIDGDADGLAGRIEFPSIDVLGVLELREDVVDAGLGMPRDLDGQNGIDAADHAGDYQLLPVRVVIEWDGVRGARRLALETVLWAR